jgi:hypothetical protein
MSVTSTKRNYIRRKKFLDKITSQIVTTLEFIAVAIGEFPDSSQIHKVAFAHAQGVEAACWSPRPRPTAEAYEKLISAKTAELCQALTRQALPRFIRPPAPRDSVSRPTEFERQIPFRMEEDETGTLFESVFGDEMLDETFTGISQDCEHSKKQSQYVRPHFQSLEQYRPR